uniref:CBF domain-containing protein n=1 Tax=Caenorhabditis japonica TaxID=281687 RepID=A0A8R1E6H8_CAEJA
MGILSVKALARIVVSAPHFNYSTNIISSLTYFSILKRNPNSTLLEPVLEGLSKFAHFLSIEFYEDIVSTMENMVQNEHLKTLDQLHCINTVFVILSGDGQLLNIDPSKFYRLAYRVLNQLPFEKRPEQRKNQIIMAAKTLETMLAIRKKAVPLSRVAAFVKRLLSIELLVLFISLRISQPS